MLVLSRREGETVEFPSLDVVIRVVSTGRRRIQLGIDAPISLQVTRGEKKDSPDEAPKRVGSIAEYVIGEEFERLEGELAALAELVGAKDQRLARQVVADAIQRMTRIKRTVSASLRRHDKKVVDQWRAAHADDGSSCHADDLVDWSEPVEAEPGCVRQSEVNYVVMPAADECTCVA